MAASCFNLQERLMPSLRAATARRLADAGLRQERIASHLGVSQAMVSKYLRRPPRPMAGVPGNVVERLIETAVAETLALEGRGAVGAHCPLCTGLAAQGYVAAQAPLQEVDQCLRHDQPVARREQEAVLNALTNAEAWIRRTDLRALQPGVRMNLAMALAAARDPRDVAAFPGRLVEIRGRISAVAEPEFGSSSHLAGLLLRLQKSLPAVRAILNVRWDAAVENAAREAGLKVHSLKRQGGDLIVSLPAESRPEGVVDPGAFGIEPILYLLGPDANSVVERAVRLATKTRKTNKASS